MSCVDRFAALLAYSLRKCASAVLWQAAPLPSTLSALHPFRAQLVRKLCGGGRRRGHPCLHVPGRSALCWAQLSLLLCCSRVLRPKSAACAAASGHATFAVHLTPATHILWLTVTPPFPQLNPQSLTPTLARPATSASSTPPAQHPPLPRAAGAAAARAPALAPEAPEAPLAPPLARVRENDGMGCGVGYFLRVPAATGLFSSWSARLGCACLQLQAAATCSQPAQNRASWI